DLVTGVQTCALPISGYKMRLAHGIFVEPQASLAVLHTEIDDIDDIFGGAVDFNDETSVRGRLGLRLGHEYTASNQLIYSSDVTEIGRASCRDGEDGQ